MLKIFSAAIIAAVLVLINLSVVYANTDRADFSAVHGPNLDVADFIIRYKFEQAYGKPWEDSEFSERRDFLEGWYEAVREAKKAEEEQAKAEKEERDRIAAEVREDKLRETERLNQLEENVKNEKREALEDKRDFELMLRDQKRQLDLMRKLQGAR